MNSYEAKLCDVPKLNPIKDKKGEDVNGLGGKL